MPRIRTIKPDFWTDEKLAECSFAARLCFIGLWNFADDEGRMAYSPKRIKMQIFPGDDLDAGPLIEQELAGRGLVILYESEGQRYLHIPNFQRHQRINRPNPSLLPSPNSLNTHGAFSEHSVSDHGVSVQKNSGREEEGNGREKEGIKPLCSNFSSSNEAISSLPLKSAAKPKPKPSHEAEKLANLLQAEILKNAPNFKTTQARLRAWSLTADRMLRLDGRTPDQVAAVIRWAQGDEFWMQNILSMDKVRDKFDQLTLKIEAGSTRGARSVDRIAAHTAEFLRRHQ